MRFRFHGVPLLAGASILAITVIGLFLNPGHATTAEPAHNNSLGMSFVWIPAGSFTMGSPTDEYGRAVSETRHRVTITRPFYLQTTEVTVGQWRQIMGRRWFGDVQWPADRPIAKVSWYDVQRFIKKMNAKNEGYYRLPTEAEWEYAARAGSETTYAWGDMVDCSRALYGHSRKGKDECRDFNISRGLREEMPAPVKSYPANQWGLYDMHGNVWEWCLDIFTDYPSDPAIDPCPTDSGTMRVRRGGSWFSSGFACRSANRAYGHPASRLPNTGFRLVFETEPSPAASKVKIPQLFDETEYNK
jgi:formylglycine-generating enzyme required for sulfatase activity